MLFRSWKLIGTSNNMTLTLFKAVEREDVDAQYERTRKEGYYTDLKIVDADAKVDQPSLPKGMKKESPRSGRGGKGGPSLATRPEIAKRPATPSRKPTTARSALKSEVKPTKKKTGSSPRTSKRPAKKK